MAQAVKVPAVVGKVKKMVEMEVDEVVQPESVTLTLTMREAKVLKALVGSIGGKREGPRGSTSAIYRALDSVIPWSAATSGLEIMPRDAYDALRMVDTYPEGF